jgi:hypothetical protein
MSEKPAPKKRALIGLGLDNKDGHKRLTQAENFAVVGGSESTHAHMTETLIKTMEDLQRRRKTLDTAEEREIEDLIHKHSG